LNTNTNTKREGGEYIETKQNKNEKKGIWQQKRKEK